MRAAAAHESSPRQAHHPLGVQEDKAPAHVQSYLHVVGEGGTRPTSEVARDRAYPLGSDPTDWSAHLAVHHTPRAASQGGIRSGKGSKVAAAHLPPCLRVLNALPGPQLHPSPQPPIPPPPITTVTRPAPRPTPSHLLAAAVPRDPSCRNVVGQVAPLQILGDQHGLVGAQVRALQEAMGGGGRLCESFRRAGNGRLVAEPRVST